MEEQIQLVLTRVRDKVSRSSIYTAKILLETPTLRYYWKLQCWKVSYIATVTSMTDRDYKVERDRQRHRGINRDKSKGRPRLVGASLQLCNAWTASDLLTCPFGSSIYPSTHILKTSTISYLLITYTLSLCPK